MTRSDHSAMFIMHPPGSAGDVLAAKIATEIEKELGGDVWYGIETTDRYLKFVFWIQPSNVSRYLAFSRHFVETNEQYQDLVERQIQRIIRDFRREIGKF